jgi:predicted DNA-binding protein (MmcQ/YjbR family)
MNTEGIREYCKTLPHVTEDIKWGNDLCFLIAGKMFAVACLDRTSPNKLSFKCTVEKFAELIEREGIIPAPYMARNQWVALERFDAMRDGEIKELVRNSYEMVKAKLPKKVQAGLNKS